MALQCNLNFTGEKKLHTSTGVVNLGTETVSLDCYVKVNKVTSDKENATAEVMSTSGSAMFLSFYDFAIDLNGSNPIKQAYEHLKTLPEFAGAANV
jgi:hypothetical protein